MTAVRTCFDLGGGLILAYVVLRLRHTNDACVDERAARAFGLLREHRIFSQAAGLTFCTRRCSCVAHSDKELEPRRLGRRAQLMLPSFVPHQQVWPTTPRVFPKEDIPKRNGFP